MMRFLASSTTTGAALSNNFFRFSLLQISGNVKTDKQQSTQSQLGVVKTGLGLRKKEKKRERNIGRSVKTRSPL
jgi:hypothetical protein